MFGPSAAGPALAAGAAPPTGAGGGGGGGGGAYAGRGGSLGPRQMRIRCRDSRRSISLRSCSFINSTSLRMRLTSKISSPAFLDSVPLGSFIALFRSGVDFVGGGGFLPGCREGRRFSVSAIEKRGQKSE